MNRYSEEDPDLQKQREKIIGLGELSIRKSYYPELQQQQEALKQSEARLRSILHASPVMQFVIGQDHRVISWNKAIETYSGIRAENILGTDGQWRAFYPEKQPVLADILLDQSLDLLPVWYPDIFSRSRLVEDGYEVTRFFPYMGDSGKWLHATAVPIRDTNGVVIGAIETLEDITERKQAEESLRESEERYRVVADFTFDWEYWIAPDGTFIYVSPSCERITGHPPEEFIQDSSLLIHLTHPDDRVAVADFLSRNIQSPGGHGVLEFRIITRTGEVRWISHESQPVYTTSRKYLGQRGSNRDITGRKTAEEALKESEKFLNSVVENIPDMIFVKDARDLRFVRFNRAGEDLLGLSREDLCGKNDHDFFPKDQADFFTKKDREVLDNLQVVDIPEEKIMTRLKGERILHTKKISIVDESGKPGFLMGISEDITERKRMENALQLARNKINLLNTVTFQDIQTAAFSLAAYHDLLSTLVTDEKAKLFLEKQISLNRKITESLNFAKNYQEMGVKPPRWQNIGQVFLLAISHLDFLPITRNFFAEGLEVYADPLLEKVFFHLMQNVLKYGVHATEVTIRYQERPDGLVLFIEDNGVGIRLEEKHMIFDRGYGENTGLGLFLVREVLSITDMTIKETGEPGKGARFEITVPKEGYRISKAPHIG